MKHLVDDQTILSTCHHCGEMDYIRLHILYSLDIHSDTIIHDLKEWHDHPTIKTIPGPR